ncbi:MAG: YtxH domain-containing protein, partial [Streptococcus sp.]
TDKVRDFVKEYQENPDDIHEAVVQSAKDFSNQAVSAIQQTKEKVEKGEITTETVIESVKETTKSVVDYSQDKFNEIKEKFDKEESSLAEEEPVIFEEEEEPSEEIIIDFGAEATEGQEEKAVEIDSQEEK